MVQKSFEQQMLEALDRRNESIDAFGRAFNKGMNKLDKQADDLLEQTADILKTINDIKKEVNKAMNQ